MSWLRKFLSLCNVTPYTLLAIANLPRELSLCSFKRLNSYVTKRDMSNDRKLGKDDMGIKAQKVISMIEQQASDLNIEQYLSSDAFAPLVIPAVPESATADHTRKFQLEEERAIQQKKNIGKLRAEATAMLSDECYEYLCIQMGKSPAVILSAKEIVTGLKAHFASMTDVENDEIMTSLHKKWTPGISLKDHVISHATSRANLVAGGREPTNMSSKTALELSLTALNRMPIYSTLIAQIKRLTLDDKVSMAEHVAKLLTTLQDAQYADLLTVTAEKALAAKEDGKQAAHAARKQELAAKKKLHAAVPVGENCPIHPDARTPHTWGECSVYTGKMFDRRKK